MDKGIRGSNRVSNDLTKRAVRIKGVEPFAYLTATLEAIAAGHPQSRIDELLPWNFSPSS
ncbi:IS66 C-terminal element [Roseovarius nanhaiticus]|uniref:IS66 C-terminal element n=1 Tax=Roseovarius nanhaiticus TaxID=573024 RepID=A0A1N7HMY6_9RHOB|nr:IS66 C-terminal element [Roseovarius nanhaiticus]SIS26217.1 IS66 C-terminal element [Roseovarius nanhaiticus]